MTSKCPCQPPGFPIFIFGPSFLTVQYSLLYTTKSFLVLKLSSEVFANTVWTIVEFSLIIAGKVEGRKIWVASFKDNSWRQDSAGEVCLQSLSQAVGRSLQPPLYLQGPPQLLSLVQGLQESSNKVPRGPRCPPWNLKLRCQAFQPSWGLLLMEGFFYPQWRQLREKK